MNEIIEETLKITGIQCFYVERPPDVFPCIVYSYNEYTNTSSDCIEESFKYDIYLNLYIKEDINLNLKNIKSALSINGFIKQVINSPIQFEGKDYYQVALNYIKTMAA